MKTGIIFDMDGTLWDSAAPVARSWTETIKREGYDGPVLSEADIMRVMGMTMEAIADKLFAPLEKAERTRLMHVCGEEENAYLEKHGGMLYPKLEETLTVLSKQYPLYIVSNCQSGYIEAFLSHYGFGHFFSDILCYGDNLKRKAENISILAKRNGLERAYYVGDIQADYDATVEAGYDFIHAGYGFGSIASEVPFIKEFAELPALLEKLERERSDI